MKVPSLRELLQNLVAADGTVTTPLDGVRLFRASRPVRRLPGIFAPGACILLQGTKRAFFNGAAHVYDPTRYFCSVIPLPVEGDVPHASAEEPLLGLLVSFETRTVAEVCLALEAADPVPVPSRAVDELDGFGTFPCDGAFRNAVGGLLEALADPVLLAVLGDARLRELLFTMLRGPAGPIIRGHRGPLRSIAGVLHHIREHMADSLSIDELARQAAMSKAVFHRRFKTATSLSPLQYVKALRINEGARLIAQGTNVSSAAYQVGYSSPSQFSREFRRQFDQTPREWRRTVAPLGRPRTWIAEVPLYDSGDA